MIAIEFLHHQQVNLAVRIILFVPFDLCRSGAADLVNWPNRTAESRTVG